MVRKKEYLLRIDADLWEEIQRWAEDDLRSVNGQIEYILRRAVSSHRREMGHSEQPSEDPSQNIKPRGSDT